MEMSNTAVIIAAWLTSTVINVAQQLLKVLPCNYRVSISNNGMQFEIPDMAKSFDSYI